MNNISVSIFKRSSSTYYYSSLFFSNEVKKDVFTLYAFVRTVDNFVDQIPQDKRGFIKFKKELYLGLGGRKTSNQIINNFCLMVNRTKIKKEWIISFMNAMELDLKQVNYPSYTQLRRYINGSASVIGLMMAKILNLPTKSYKYAKLLGEAMQLINFIRDIDEDLSLGRIYIPQADLKKFHLDNFILESMQDKKNFSKLLKFEIHRYKKILKQAEAGYKYIPTKHLIPIKVASSMYQWTAWEIEKNPLIVFKRKVKPRPLRIIGEFFKLRLNYLNV